MFKGDKTTFQLVDKDFFAANLRLVQKLLDKKLTIRNKKELYFTAATFLECLGEEIEETECELSIDQAASYIEKTLKESLYFFSLEEWISIGCLCEQCLNKETEQNILVIKEYKPEQIINSSLELYEEVDPNFLKMASKVLKQKNFYIYLNDMNLNQLFNCKILDCNILMSSISSEQKEYFIHELTHAVVSKYFPSLPILLDEMPSMFFETLMYEKESRKLGFRPNRIKNTLKGMANAYNYSNILTRFEFANRKLDANNIYDILEVKSLEEIANFYDECKADAVINSLKYTMSFLYTVYLVDLYHEDKKLALCKLREFLYDCKELLPNSNLIDLYEKNICRQSKTYVKK